MLRYAAVALYFFVILGSCSNLKTITQNPPAQGINTVKLLGQYEMPYNLQFKKTTIGGLSGIDYDVKNDEYYFICDDRSDIDPARFYTAKIFISAKGIDSMRFINTAPLQQPGRLLYPNKKADKYHVPDPEAIRYNPLKKELVWSSEGERIVKENDTVIINPSIITMTRGGTFKNSFELPSNLIMNAEEKGPRQNGVLEGMSFADNYKTLFVNVEEPLYEDGPRADLTPNNAYVRFFKFDVATRKNTAQYAYKLEPVAYPANPANAFKINGIPDILNIGDNKFIVIERSFSTGRQACTIRVFTCSLEGATDIKNIPSLKANHNFTAASKKLLLNMDDLGIYIDNVEGVTFGPTLPNGHRTLLFVADNNFSKDEKAQLLLFEITE